MKIAFIGQKGIPARAGGVERHVEELATRLVMKGHEVVVYARNSYTDKNMHDYKGVRLVHLPSIPTKHLDAITHTLLAAIHALYQDYTIIHFQSIGPSVLCWIIRLLKRGSPLIATFHSMDYLHQKWGFFARLFLRFGEYMICTVPKKTVVLTQVQKQYVNDRYNTDPVVIPNGYGIRFNAGTGLLEHWGLTKKKYILCVSRLIPHKGIHYLIDAFKQMEDAGTVPVGFKLVIVGSGFYTDAYEERLKVMGTGRQSIIFTGTQSGQALEQLFSHAYVFVQPSESEGLSISLLEALGCGVAPLVSSIPENMEPLQGLGFSFVSRDVADLKERLSWLLHHPAAVEATGAGVHELAHRQYSWDAITDSYIRLYEEVLA